MKTKPVAEFYQNKHKANVLIRTYCKTCENEKCRQYKSENKDKIKEMKRLWDFRNGDNRRINSLVDQQKNPFALRGISRPVLRGIYNMSPWCHYCKVALNPDEASFDHKMPISRGGLDKDPDNIVTCCRDCNYLKHTRTESEFVDFIKIYINRFRDNTEPIQSNLGVRDGQGINPLNVPIA